MQRAIDLTEFGTDILVPMTARQLSCVLAQAQKLCDQFEPDVLKTYMQATQEELLQAPDPEDWNWLVRALTTVAVQGLLGQPVPEVYDLDVDD